MQKFSDRTPHLCRKCGKEYIVATGTQRYCPDCGKEVHREASKERQRAKAENNIGSVIRCRYCGKECVKTTPKQYYCPQCRDIAVKEIDRKQGIDYYNKNRDTINPKRNAKRKQERKTRND